MTRLFKTITDPNHSHISFLLGVLFPFYCALIIINPALALLATVITAAITQHRIRAARTRREAALAERKATWGF